MATGARQACRGHSAVLWLSQCGAVVVSSSGIKIVGYSLRCHCVCTARQWCLYGVYFFVLILLLKRLYKAVLAIIALTGRFYHVHRHLLDKNKDANSRQQDLYGNDVEHNELRRNAFVAVRTP